MLDEKRVINEVAARNGIRIDADDPFFASATMVQLALEETLQIVEERFRKTIAEFESHIRHAERSAGKAVAQEAKAIESKRFEWWARRDSNPGPPACEAGALTS